MKKQVTLVYRAQSKNARSIERLFGVLETQLQREFDILRVVVPNGSGKLSEIVANVLFTRKNAKGIIHITGDIQYLAAFLPGRRTILTVHDCGYLLSLKGFKRLIYKWLWFTLPCWRAGQVTVISQATREILEQQVGKLGDKLSVIDNCITIDLPPTKRAFNASRPRILQIGTGRHKNLDTLIKAVDGLACELKIIGNPSNEDLAALENCKVQYNIESNVTDTRISQIYGECDILFFASRHEGFGLPILEAHAAGIPVITANCYSMPYVAGEGAIIVDPESPEQIRLALETICRDKELRERLLKVGRKNVSRFHPQTIASRYVKIYQGTNC